MLQDLHYEHLSHKNELINQSIIQHCIQSTSPSINQSIDWSIDWLIQTLHLWLCSLVVSAHTVDWFESFKLLQVALVQNEINRVNHVMLQDDRSAVRVAFSICSRHRFFFLVWNFFSFIAINNVLLIVIRDFFPNGPPCSCIALIVFKVPLQD